MNDRIIIHPPKKTSDNKYTLTVSYYIDGQRKQIRRSKIKTSKDAKALGEKIKKKLEEEMPIIKATGERVQTLEEFAKDYVKIKNDNWATATLIQREGSLKYCDFKDLPMNEITAKDIELNLAWLKDKYKYNTVNGIMAGWDVFLNAAVRYGYLFKNPNNTKLVKPKQDVKVKALTLDQAQKLVASIEDPQIRLLTLIGYSCGLRRGECLDLNMRDFDFVNKEVTISHQHKKTKEGFRRNQPLKTQNSYRSITVPDKVLDEIKNHPYRGIDGSLFITGLTTLAARTNRLYKKLGYDISFHGLRHTFVTALIASNRFDVQSVASLAGDTVGTILKTYSHYLEETKIQNAVKLNEIFGWQKVE